MNLDHTLPDEAHPTDRRPGVAKSARKKIEAAKALLELFTENPFWTTTRVANWLDVAFTTAGRAIDRLQAAGIVAPVGGARRNPLYCAEAMLRLLERDEPGTGTR